MKPGSGHKSTIGLVQINNSFSNQNYLPYAVGLLEAYIRQHRPHRFDFLLPIYSRIPIDVAVQYLVNADVIGFSAYVWNIRISLEVARRVKILRPDILIVFGGPQVPDRPEEFLRQNPFIDIVCHGEGEKVFLQILDNLDCQEWKQVASISYIKDGECIRNPKITRTSDLSEFSSPYLSEVFRSLMQANPDEQWLALWETNRGCPFGCTFCDWGSAVQSKVYAFDLERLHRELTWFAQNRIEFIFCCDANFGILQRDVEIAEYAANTKQLYGYPKALSVQNTKNATDRAYRVQKILADSGLNKGVTISFQSIDPQTLMSVKRKNISSRSFQDLQRRFTNDQIETYSDLILGLPGETYDSFVEGVSEIIRNGQHNRIQFNNLAILPNAEMGDPEYRKKYGLLSVETKIINIHGALEECDQEITETQELVVATSTMPKEDWVKTRAFSWMTSFLHFDKVLQIPLILMHELGGFSYRRLLETFSETDHPAFPVISEIKRFFQNKALDIQNGGPEYCNSDQWLNIWWPADEYILIKLVFENKIQQFYSEAERLLQQILQSSGVELPDYLLKQSIHLNQILLKRPFQYTDVNVEVTYNVWEFYRAIVNGQTIELTEKSCLYQIDRTSSTWSTWDDWCREVIWYGNKKGAYLYGNHPMELQLTGHY